MQLDQLGSFLPDTKHKRSHLEAGLHMMAGGVPVRTDGVNRIYQLTSALSTRWWQKTEGVPPGKFSVSLGVQGGSSQGIAGAQGRFVVFSHA